MSDYDSPKVYTITNPKARKEHRCCECRGVIQVGEIYERYTGIWDEPDTFKTCPDCVALRDEISTETKNNYTFECLHEECEYEPWHDRFRMIVEKRKRKEVAV